MSPLIKRTIVVMGCLVLGCGVARSSFAQSGQNILPQAFGAWTATSRQTFKPTQPPAASGVVANPEQASTAAREYGLVAGETANYSHGASGAGSTLTATDYRMKDPIGAYVEYSYQRTPFMAAAAYMVRSATKPHQVLVPVGI